jgi:hypothetical protein
MAVQINIVPPKKPKRGNRAGPLIRRVREIAPTLRELRAAGRLTVGDMAEALNDLGVHNAAGRPWIGSTMHRALKTAESLGLGVAPQTVERSRKTRRGWSEAGRMRITRS